MIANWDTISRHFWRILAFTLIAMILGTIIAGSAYPAVAIARLLLTLVSVVGSALLLYGLLSEKFDYQVKLDAFKHGLTVMITISSLAVGLLLIQIAALG